MNTTLYRLYDADGSLLYVGIALAPFARFVGHKADKTWWVDVARIELANFDSRVAAMQAEAKAIKAESPRYNKDHQIYATRRALNPLPDVDLIVLDDDLNPVVA